MLFGYHVLIDDDGVVTGDRFLVDPRPLDAIVEEIKTVHAARIQRTGGRLGLDPSLPRLIDDVNLLRDFYVEAKAYEHPYVTPQPPSRSSPTNRNPADARSFSADCDPGTSYAHAVAGNDPNRPGPARLGVHVRCDANVGSRGRMVRERPADRQSADIVR